MQELKMLQQGLEVYDIGNKSRHPTAVLKPMVFFLVSNNLYDQKAESKE